MSDGWSPMFYEECEAFCALRSAVTQRRKTVEQIPNFPGGRSTYTRRMRRVLHPYNTPDTWILATDTTQGDFPIGTKNATITTAEKFYQWVTDRIDKDNTFVAQVSGNFSSTQGREDTPFTLRSGNGWIVHSSIDLRTCALVLHKRCTAVSEGILRDGTVNRLGSKKPGEPSRMRIVTNPVQVEHLTTDITNAVFPKYCLVLVKKIACAKNVE